jgi:D-alanyl-D-alanine dipeptidase
MKNFLRIGLCVILLKHTTPASANDVYQNESSLSEAQLLTSTADRFSPPEGIVNLHSINPRIQIELRYLSKWNFVGRPIVGYDANKCYLTKAAAKALSMVQKDVEKMGFSLLVFDCYRPQKSVQQFMNWTQNPRDQIMKHIFYPDEPKQTLVEKGYIAARSGHSRASTVDLTLIRNHDLMKPLTQEKLKYQEREEDCRHQKHTLENGQLDMGTLFDCFSSVANTDDSSISEHARKNRLLLKRVMEKHGFINYEKEWWHYTLKNEPYANQYFDFDIK